MDTLDNDTYKSRVEYVQNLIVANEKNGAFLSYFNSRLLPLLESHVITPVRNGQIEHNWTTNNAESANHILKSVTSWKLCDLPKFIELWQQIVETEFKERERAIRDMGHFKLSSSHNHHIVEMSAWATMNNEQQLKRIKRFRSDKGRESTNIME